MLNMNFKLFSALAKNANNVINAVDLPKDLVVIITVTVNVRKNHANNACNRISVTIRKVFSVAMIETNSLYAKQQNYFIVFQRTNVCNTNVKTVENALNLKMDIHATVNILAIVNVN